MNKKQNTKVDIAATVGQIQRAGIEVMAGFIFGWDEDTIDTADAIAAFATQVAIPTAMTGMLTPIPHTPLRERLRAEGRLREAEFSGNNTDDAVQFVPRRMSVAEMQRGYYRILEALFAPGAMFRRSRALLERLEPHIFHGGNLRVVGRSCGASLAVAPGCDARRRGSTISGSYGKGGQRDAAQRRAARRALADLKRQMRSLSAAGQAWLAKSELRRSLDHSSSTRARPWCAPSPRGVSTTSPHGRGTVQARIGRVRRASRKCSPSTDGAASIS